MNIFKDILLASDYKSKNLSLKKYDYYNSCKIILKKAFFKFNKERAGRKI